MTVRPADARGPVRRLVRRSFSGGGSLGEGGFSLVELLMALVVCGLLSGAIAGLLAPSRAAFAATPATIDLRQRARFGLDVLATALRSAGADVSASEGLGPLAELMPIVTPLVSAEATADDGEFSALRIVSVVPGASQGRLDRDQPGPAGALTLDPTPGCPQVSDVCGFKPGMTAAMVDGLGHFDVFTVASTDAVQKRLTPGALLTMSYPAGSLVVEVESNTFELQRQADGTRSLVRIPAGGVAQPMIDGVASIGFVPFYEGSLRRLDVWLRVQALDESLRRLSRVPERRVQLSVALRNAR